MRKIITIMATAAMALTLFASSAVAGGHEWHEEPHAHVMLVRVDIDEGALTFRNCVDFSVNENAGTDYGALPTPAHHHSVHTGNPGGSPMVQGPLYEAGNWVIPLFPYIPFEELTGCDAFTSGMPSPF